MVAYHELFPVSQHPAPIIQELAKEILQRFQDRPENRSHQLSPSVINHFIYTYTPLWKIPENMPQHDSQTCKVFRKDEDMSPDWLKGKHLCKQIKNVELPSNFKNKALTKPQSGFDTFG